VTGTPSKVQCRKDLPGAIYLSSQLPADEQAKAVSK
jgi:ribose transport system substrate-binding protein